MRRCPFALLTVALMGFASGLPLFLTGFTLKAWLTQSGLNIKAIGLFGIITLPYSLKFLWAPLLDRYLPPFLGRRRGWMVLFQAVLVLLLVLMALSDPRLSVTRIALLGLLVAFASASQDIVVDAWRREAFEEHDLGLANAVNIGAYRVAMLASGGGALILAGRTGWRFAYLVMAGLMAMGALGTFLAWSTDGQVRPPRTLREAVELPLKQLLRRPAIAEILAFCLLYKIGDQLADSMSAPFLLRGMGFTLQQIGATTKTVGMISLVAGGLLGGLLMKKLSLKWALVLFGLCQCGSILAFWALSRLGPLLSVLTGALALENLCWGMGTAAFATFLMLLCARRYTATQYALLTSILAFTRGLLSTPAGLFQARFGWSGYFLGCALVAIPGLLLLSRYDRWGIEEVGPEGDAG